MIYLLRVENLKAPTRHVFTYPVRESTLCNPLAVNFAEIRFQPEMGRFGLHNITNHLFVLNLFENFSTLLGIKIYSGREFQSFRYPLSVPVAAETVERLTTGRPQCAHLKQKLFHRIAPTT